MRKASFGVPTLVSTSALCVFLALLASACAEPGTHAAAQNMSGPLLVSFSPVADVNAPAPSSEFTTSNAWYGTDSSGNDVEVWAGSSGQDPSQGELVIHVLKPNGDGTYSTLSVNSYNTPSRDGTATITSDLGSQLTITATDGTTWGFDTATDSYISITPTQTASAAA